MTRGSRPTPTGPRRLLAVVDLLARAMAYASGALLLLVSLYITADVIGRNFGISSAVSDEMGGYVLAVGGMWALAYTLRSGAHVRIDILLPYLPRLLRAALDYVAFAVMALFASALAYSAWRLAIESLTTDARAMSVLRTPLFVPQALMALGFSMLALEAFAMLGAGLAESLGTGRLASLEGVESPALAGPVAPSDPA